MRRELLAEHPFVVGLLALLSLGAALEWRAHLYASYQRRLEAQQRLIASARATRPPEPSRCGCRSRQPVSLTLRGDFRVRFASLHASIDGMLVLDVHRGLVGDVPLFRGAVPPGEHLLVLQTYVAPRDGGPTRMVVERVPFTVPLEEHPTNIVVTLPLQL